MEKSPRFAGIDLLRIIAAYGVVLLHSGLNHDYQVTPAGSALQQVFEFAVPAFLAISFFLQVFRDRPFRLSARAWRLLVPYFAWTVIHLAARTAKYAHQPPKLHGLFADPVALIFFGSASVQLYFLPLLFTGSCLCGCLATRLRRISPILLLALLAATTAASWLMMATGNGFDIATGCAFQRLILPPLHSQTIRVLLVLAAWLIRCLPYVIGAALFARAAGSPLFAAWTAVPWGLLFAFTVLLPLPPGLGEVTAAFSALGLALALSSLITSQTLLPTAATLAFGIYLVHDLVLACFSMALPPQQLPMISLPILLCISVATFLISAAITWVASRTGKPGRLIFAVS